MILTSLTMEFNTGQVAIGDYAYGGIVAYILQPGDPGYDANIQHGLVVSEDINIISLEWNYDFCQLGGDTSPNFGTGAQNTYNVVVLSDCSLTEGGAIYSAYYSNYNGYNDWYLPSYEEIKKLWLTKDLVPGWQFQPEGDNPYTTNVFWSSSVVESDAGRQTYTLTFNNPPVNPGIPVESQRSLPWNARYVRSF